MVVGKKDYIIIHLCLAQNVEKFSYKQYAKLIYNEITILQFFEMELLNVFFEKN